MKVLQICTRFPPGPGGVETHVLEISKRMRARGHDVRVYTSDLYSETPWVRIEKLEDTVEGVPVRRFPASTPGHDLHYVFYPKMIRPVFETDADVVHAHSYGYFQTNLLSALRRLRRRPSVITAHFHPESSMWGGEQRVAFRRVYDKVFGRRALNGVDIVIAHTKNEIELMKKVGIDTSGNRVRIVPAGIDFSKFETPPDGAKFRKAFSIPEGERIVLFTGRLAVNKGLLVLAEAAPAILKDFPDTRFVLVGGDMGAQEALEKKLDKLGVRKRFLLTGHVKDDGLFRSAYGACDVFTLPSEYEAFGLVLLEAMATRKPCVASAVGGMPEVLGHDRQSAGQTKCGLLAEYGDAAGLSGAIIRLLGDDALRKKMGAAGRERVRDHFTWESVTDRLLGIYKELAC